MKEKLKILVAIVLLLGLASCTSTAIPTHPALDEGEEQTIETASYVIRIWTGPEVTLAMEFPIMAMMDQGQPVNHHLEVHIFDKSSGDEVLEVIPVVEITDQETGISRGLPTVTACLEGNHREIAPHFGDNLYLPDGKYTVTVEVGDEIASFETSK